MKSTHRPEWLRPKDVPTYFGLGRSKTYEVLATGKVKTASLRKRGQKHGTRLISYDSLAAYLDSLASGGDALDLNSKDFDTTPSNGEVRPSGRT